MADTFPFPPSDELARMIAWNVSDPRTLRQLCLVNKSFYAATRPALWAEVIVTNWDPAYRRDAQSVLQRLQNALDSDIIRAECVKAFKIPVARPSASLLIPILLRLSNLREMVIVDSRDNANPGDMNDFYTLCDLLPEFTDLRHLDLDLPGTRWERNLSQILSKCPNVRSLGLATGYYSESGPPNPMAFPSLSSLNNLDLVLYDTTFPLLALIAEKAPRLHHICIFWDAFRAGIDGEDIQRLRSCASLTSLFNDRRGAIYPEIWDAVFGDYTPNAFPNLTTAANRVSELDTDEEAMIPPLPAMELLILLEDEGIERQQDVSRNVEEFLGKRAVQIHGAASLQRIFFSTWNRFRDSREICQLQKLTTAEWCGSNIQGVLVRTYTNGREHLLHLRGRRTPPNVYHGSEDLRQVDCRHHDDWFDLAIWNTEQRLSDEVLSSVYALLGESLEWEKPGRALELPEEAWALRRQSTAVMEEDASGT